MQHDCKRPSITRMDYKRVGDDGKFVHVVNRVCLTCMTHWFGESEVAVVEFPRLSWDRWMNTAAEFSA